MEIEVRDIPAVPESVLAYLPVVGEVEAGEWDRRVGALGGQMAEAPTLDLDLGLEGLSEPIGGGAGSLIDFGSMWKVQELTEGDDGVEVTLGRRRGKETSIRLPREWARDLEPGSLIVGPSQELYEKRNWLGHVTMLVEFRPEPGAEPTDVDVFLPLVRLHCPSHPGCNAEYSTATGSGSEGKVEMSLFGVGGGAGKSMTCTLSETYATGERCKEIGVPAKLRVQTGRTYVNDTEVAYGMRASIEQVATKDLIERTLSAGHGCQLPYEEVAERAEWKMDRRGVDGKEDELNFHQIEMERESEGKVTVGLEIGSAPLKLGMEYVRKTSFKAAVKTGVSPGARYAAYAPPGDGGFEILWTAEA